MLDISLQMRFSCSVRLHEIACAAMSNAVDEHMAMEAAHGENEMAARLQLWPEEALQLLLYTVLHDPSVRMRRACMGLLTSAAVR